MPRLPTAAWTSGAVSDTERSTETSVMANSPSVLFEFSSAVRTVYVSNYQVRATGIYSFPRWKGHPLRQSMEQSAIAYAQTMFGKFPALMHWPEETDEVSDEFAWFTGV